MINHAFKPYMVEESEHAVDDCRPLTPPSPDAQLLSETLTELSFGRWIFSLHFLVIEAESLKSSQNGEFISSQGRCVLHCKFIAIPCGGCDIK